MSLTRSAAGVPEPRARRVSMADVARRAGVSAQTVSRVSNGHPGVVDSTRRQVLAAIEELGYRPNSAARALKRGEFRTIGDVTCTGCVESDADTPDAVVTEVAAARLTERGATRADDRISEAGMEDRKKEGYF